MRADLILQLFSRKRSEPGKGIGRHWSKQECAHVPDCQWLWVCFQPTQEGVFQSCMETHSPLTTGRGLPYWRWTSQTAFHLSTRKIQGWASAPSPVRLRTRPAVAHVGSLAQPHAQSALVSLPPFAEKIIFFPLNWLIFVKNQLTMCIFSLYNQIRHFLKVNKISTSFSRL